MEVNPDTLLFTQDSIKNTFKQPREDERIDDAVDSLLEGSIEASDFPMLSVVSYEGRLWSLDNRRLWVFKKAEVPSIAVSIVPYYQNPRFRELIECNHKLKNSILKPGYWPRVRGPCRQEFHPPVARGYFFDTAPVQVKHKPIRKLNTVSETSPDACAYEGDYSRGQGFVDSTWPLPGIYNQRRSIHRQVVPNVMKPASTAKPFEVGNHAFTSAVSGPDEVLDIRRDASHGQDRATNHPTAYSLYSSNRQEDRAKDQPTVRPIYASYGLDRAMNRYDPPAARSIHASYRQEDKTKEQRTVSPIHASHRLDTASSAGAVVHNVQDGSAGQKRRKDDANFSIEQCIGNLLHAFWSMFK